MCASCIASLVQQTTSRTAGRCRFAQCAESVCVSGHQQDMVANPAPYTEQYAVFCGQSILLILTNTQYFRGVDTTHTDYYAVFSGVDNPYTLQHAVFSGNHAPYTEQYAVFCGESILLLLSNTQHFRGVILLILCNTQYYRGIDTAFTKQSTVLSEVHTSHTMKYAVFSGG